MLVVLWLVAAPPKLNAGVVDVEVAVDAAAPKPPKVLPVPEEVADPKRFVELAGLANDEEVPNRLVAGVDVPVPNLKGEGLAAFAPPRGLGVVVVGVEVREKGLLEPNIIFLLYFSTYYTQKLI